MDIVDAHVHVWDTDRLPYPWLADASTLPPRRLPSDVDDADGRIARWIFIEADAAASAALAEARATDALDWPGLEGIVPHADLTDPAVDEHLARLSEIPRVRGVRHLLQSLPDDRPWPTGLRGGLAALVDRDLSFDACVRWVQLPALVDVLREVPGLAVVLDHLGKPPVDEGLRSAPGQAWLAGLRQFAALPGSAVKLSGLPAEASSADSLARNAPEFLRAALDAFGAERCMFGSDWPVSTVACDVGEWVDLVTEAAAGYDAAAVFADTAWRFYRISGINPREDSSAQN
jgi:L-fuconolactonase